MGRLPTGERPTKRPRQPRLTLQVPLHADTAPDAGPGWTVGVDPPRAVWQLLGPLLLDAPPGIARRAAGLLLRRQLDRSPHFVEDSDTENRNSAGWEPMERPRAASRTIRIGDDRCVRRLLGRRRTAVLTVRPCALTRLEASLEGRLIHCENELIRAQSLAGFLSTLGGGFFMCHHWRTAVAMARQQQRMARVLGDTNMLFKSLVNQAYNLIYAGHFRSARELLWHVAASVRDERPSEAPVLINMVRSALLFRRRVKAFATEQSKRGEDEARTTAGVPDQQHSAVARTTVKVHSGSSVSRGRWSKTMDDYGRIRVTQDESSAEDIRRAFHGRSM